VTSLSILVGFLAAGATITALLLQRRKRLTGTPSSRPGRIDAFAVGEPWRHHVAAALSAQRRFASIVGTVEPGPLRNRMVEIGRQVDRGVGECWEIARRGDQLDDTIRHLSGASVQARLDRATDPTEVASLQSQLAAIDRIRTSRNQTDARLQVLQTRLGELVSQAAEVATGVDHTSELGTAVDDVVTQLEALRLAFRDLNGTASGDTAT
jgi:hypothetical protein